MLGGQMGHQWQQWVIFPFCYQNGTEGLDQEGPSQPLSGVCLILRNMESLLRGLKWGSEESESSLGLQREHGLDGDNPKCPKL